MQHAFPNGFWEYSSCCNKKVPFVIAFSFFELKKLRSAFCSIFKRVIWRIIYLGN